MFSFSTTLFVLLPIACVVYGAIRMSRIGQRETGLPPGPPTVPFLGNLPIFPKVQVWYKFTEWAKTYGDCYSLKIGPQNVIVLSSMAAVNEVLEANSALTPSRPASRVTDIVTDGLNFVLAPYGNTWRNMRRVAHLLLTPQACVKHIPVQKAETYQLMWDLLKKPKEFHNSVRRFTFSLTISVLYGKRIPQWNSPEFNAFFHMQGKWQAIMAPGAAPPVDLIPILDYIPTRWAPWKRAAEHVRELQKNLYGGLLEQSQRRLKSGNPNGCFVEGVIEKQKEYGITDPQLMRIGGVLIGAGAESTSSFINTLIMAMALNPEALQRAQEEIDQVIGSDRLPQLSDVANLQYVQAIISETHRWRPVNPICIPHAALQDVSYNGYVIPKGSTIFANNWGIFHDPKVFPDHEEFKPERFLDTSLAGASAKTLHKDRKHHAGFGYGRRMCPGVHLVDNTLGLSIVTLLWGFSIKKAIDPATKQPIDIDVWNFSKGITTSPNAFECDIQPRSAQHVELLEHAFVGSTEIFQNYEHELCPEDRAYVDGVRASF